MLESENMVAISAKNDKQKIFLSYSQTAYNHVEEPLLISLDGTDPSNIESVI